MSTLTRACFFAFALLLLPLHVAAWNRGHVDRFAELPAGAANPEGITADRHGNGGWIYVTNLSLDLRLFGHPTVDSQWAAAVNVHTIARIRARIP